MPNLAVLSEDLIPVNYNTDAFRNAIEDHLEILRNHPETTLVEVTPIDALSRTGDFYGVLADKHVPQYLWWTIMRMNRMTSPHHYTGAQIRFIVPNENFVTRISQAVATRHILNT